MALTLTEEAQTRALIAQEAALLSLAAEEPTIISNLGATDVSLSDLSVASSLADADLLLVKQGGTDKSISGLIVKASATAPDASETVKGIVELATLAEAQAGTDTEKAVTPAGLSLAIPPGGVIYFAGNSVPSGYLKADGSLVSRATYARLFAAIGTVFGVGDGSTTFAVPDLRGEFIRGFDDGRGVDAGRVFGSAQTDEFESHTHQAPIYNSGGANGGVGVQGSDIATNAFVSATASTGGAETRPRNIALMPCIKY